MIEHLGYDLAALGTALLWSFSALAWSLAGRRVGSVPVAAIRIVLAAGLLCLVHWLLFGSPWPTGMDRRALVLLTVSGAVAACAADLCLFRGLVLIGPRQGMLIQSLAPIGATLVALGSLDERPSLQAAAGIAMTVGGVAWVLAEQKGRIAWRAAPSEFRRGVLLCVAAVLLVSIGYVLSRMALLSGSAGTGRVHPLSAALVRVTAASAGTWLALPVLGRTRATISALSDRRAMRTILLATVIGPVLGMWLSMVALAGMKSGVAVALINTSPLMLIPIVYVAYGERPSPRTLLGTLLAVAGIFLLMSR